MKLRKKIILFKVLGFLRINLAFFVFLNITQLFFFSYFFFFFTSIQKIRILDFPSHWSLKNDAPSRFVFFGGGGLWSGGFGIWSIQNVCILNFSSISCFFLLSNILRSSLKRHVLRCGTFFPFDYYFEILGFIPWLTSSLFKNVFFF